MMKTKRGTWVAALALSTGIAVSAAADEPRRGLTKLWETEAVLKVPEGARYDAANQVVYVSNIDGEPWADDQKGSVARIGLDGKVIDAEWITGLSCPKGLALSADGRSLYVVDAGGVVVVDVKAGAIANKIAIPEGVQLNDIASDGKDTFYVSDSRGRKVFVVKDGKASVFLDEAVLKGPNGLLVHDGTLYVLDNNALNRVTPDKTLEVIADGMTGGVDGVEHVGGGDFLVSVWGGALWYVKADGKKELLFDGKPTETRTADMGWDPATRTVYVPTFFKNTLIAFRLD